MKGPGILQGTSVFGVQGVPSPLNYPSGRGFGVTTWVDLNGNLWMFGGLGLDGNGLDNILDELWMYNVNTNEWTWMGGTLSGAGQGNYGQVTVPAATNWPISKCESAASWVDNSGDLWMYGGISFSALNISCDDVWRYNIATATWTWMSGQNPASVTVATPTNFGQLGVASPTNTPGARMIYSRWKDQQGRFWIFGGSTLNALPATFPADMWMYDPATLQWTWMAGIAGDNDSTTFTTTCVPGGVPSGSFEDRACWTDECGRFWSMSAGSNIFFSHLWVFDPVTLQFTWVTGTLSQAAPPVYGVQGVPAPTNYPDGSIGSNAFVSQQGELWLFGGLTINSGSGTSCLWRYQPDPFCPATTIQSSLAETDSTGCAPFQMQFGVSGNISASYSWNFGDPSTTADTSNIATPTYTYTAPGSYTATLITNYGICNNSPDTSFVTIQVFAIPVVDLGNDTTLCPGQLLQLNAQNPGSAYLWNTGATSQSLSVSQTGNYIVAVSNTACVASDSIRVEFVQEIDLGDQTTLCGNVNGLVLDAQNPGATYLWNTGETTQTLTVTEAGLYSVSINTGNCILTDSIVVTGIVGEAAVYIPNSFTPNGDGLNDRFSGYGESFTSFRLLIFNRWGELIFETTNPAGWDGTYTGQRAESEVYVYKLTYTSSCTGGKFVDRLGHVLLVR